MDQTLNRVATKKNEEIKRTTKQKRWQDDTTRKEGTTWNVKATDRSPWKTLMEGCILQWMDKAEVNGETGKQQTEDNGRH